MHNTLSRACGWTLLLLLIVIGLSQGCGEEAAVICTDETPIGSWETAGEPFTLNWCRGCHSRDLPTGSRSDAPFEINFDSKDDVLNLQQRILERLTNRTMPPVAEVPDREQEAFVNWLQCGDH